MALLQVVVESLRRQRPPGEPRGHQIKVATGKSINAARSRRGLEKFLGFQKIRPHRAIHFWRPKWFHINPDIHGHQKNQNGREDGKPSRESRTSKSQGSRHTKRAGDLIEVKWRTDISVERQPFQNPKSRNQEIDQRETRSDPAPFRRTGGNELENNPHLGGEQGPCYRGSEVRRASRHPQKLEMPTHHAARPEREPKHPQPEGKQHPRRAAYRPLVERSTKQRNRQHGPGNEPQIGSSIQRRRRKAGIHALAQEAASVEPTQGALGAESPLPTFKRPQLEHGQKTCFPQRGQVGSHREEHHNYQKQSHGLPMWTLLARHREILGDRKSSQRGNRHQRGFPIGKRQRRKNHAEQHGRSSCSRPKKTNQGPKYPRKNRQRDGDDEMLEARRAGEHRGIQKKQNPAKPGCERVSNPPAQKEIHPARPQKKACGYGHFASGQKAKYSRACDKEGVGEHHPPRGREAGSLLEHR